METKPTSPFRTAILGVVTIILVIASFCYIATTMPADDLAGSPNWVQTGQQPGN